MGSINWTERTVHFGFLAIAAVHSHLMYTSFALEFRDIRNRKKDSE